MAPGVPPRFLTKATHLRSRRATHAKTRLRARHRRLAGSRHGPELPTAVPGELAPGGGSYPSNAGARCAGNPKEVDLLVLTTVAVDRHLRGLLRRSFGPFEDASFPRAERSGRFVGALQEVEEGGVRVSSRAHGLVG